MVKSFFVRLTRTDHNIPVQWPVFLLCLALQIFLFQLRTTAQQFTSDKGEGICFRPHARVRMSVCMYVCLSVCLSVCKITQQRVHGFGRDVACRQMSVHGRTD